MDGTHPPKSPSHEGAGSWQLCSFPAPCSQTPRTTHQLCGGIEQTPWPSFTPCSTIIIAQTLLTTHAGKSSNQCKHALVLRVLLKYSLLLPESKTANRPEQRYSTAKFRQACNIPGLLLPIYRGFAPPNCCKVAPALPLRQHGVTKTRHWK